MRARKSGVRFGMGRAFMTVSDGDTGKGKPVDQVEQLMELVKELAFMLRITIHETVQTMAITLEGRVVGAWAAELAQAWSEAAGAVNGRAVTVDLRSVTGVDRDGKRILSAIEMRTGATLIATTPWTKQLADEICQRNESD